MRLTHGIRVRVNAVGDDGIEIPPTDGTVKRLRRADNGAWVELDTRLDDELHSFAADDEAGRGRHVLTYPESSRTALSRKMFAHVAATYPDATLDLSGSDPVLAVGAHTLTLTDERIAMSGPRTKKTMYTASFLLTLSLQASRFMADAPILASVNGF